MLWCRGLSPCNTALCLVAADNETRVVIRLEKNGPYLPEEYPLGRPEEWLQVATQVPNISIVSHSLEPRAGLKL